MHNDSMNAKLNAESSMDRRQRLGLWLKVGDSKLQPETCSLPLRGPSTRQRYLPALCSSVMAFAPSSILVGQAYVDCRMRMSVCLCPVYPDPLRNVPTGREDCITVFSTS